MKITIDVPDALQGPLATLAATKLYDTSEQAISLVILRMIVEALDAECIFSKEDMTRIALELSRPKPLIEPEPPRAVPTSQPPPRPTLKKVNYIPPTSASQPSASPVPQPQIESDSEIPTLKIPAEKFKGSLSNVFVGWRWIVSEPLRRTEDSTILSFKFTTTQAADSIVRRDNLRPNFTTLSSAFDALVKKGWLVKIVDSPIQYKLSPAALAWVNDPSNQKLLQERGYLTPNVRITTK